jgi:hypothetical protein
MGPDDLLKTLQYSNHPPREFMVEALSMGLARVLRNIPKLENRSEPWWPQLPEPEHTCHTPLAGEMAWSNQLYCPFCLAAALRKGWSFHLRG